MRQTSVGTLTELDATTLRERKQMTYYYGKDARDEWRWHLKADNQKVIAVSGVGYNHERDCVAAIERVKSSKDVDVKKLDRILL